MYRIYFLILVLSKFDLGLDDPDKALIGALRGEAQRRDGASPVPHVDEFAVLDSASAGKHSAEGSWRPDGSYRERNYE
jgi:hypothetical protein